MGFGTLLCTVGFQCGRKGKECFAERERGGQRAAPWNDELELASIRAFFSFSPGN